VEHDQSLPLFIAEIRMPFSRSSACLLSSSMLSLQPLLSREYQVHSQKTRIMKRTDQCSCRCDWNLSLWSVSWGSIVLRSATRSKHAKGGMASWHPISRTGHWCGKSANPTRDLRCCNSSGWGKIPQLFVWRTSVSSLSHDPNPTTQNKSSKQWVKLLMPFVKWVLGCVTKIISALPVASSDILNIVFGLMATLLACVAIWATRRYNNATRGNSFDFWANYTLNSDLS
jgi:hypothetical protein